MATHLCAACSTTFLAGAWLGDGAPACAVLDKRLAERGGTVNPASVLDRAYCLMQMQKALGNDTVQQLGGGAHVSGWYRPAGAPRRILAGPLGEAYLAASLAQTEHAAAQLARGDAETHWQLKLTVADRLWERYGHTFYGDDETGPAVHLARLEDLGGKPAVLHRMQDYLIFLFSLELTTRLEHKCARLCSAADLATWLGDEETHHVLRQHNFVSFDAEGAITYVILCDKIQNKADPGRQHISPVCYPLTNDNAPRLALLLKQWRGIATAAQTHLGYLEEGPINCESAPFLYFNACEPRGGGEPHMPPALPPAGADPVVHAAKLSAVISNRLRAIQVEHSTAEEREAATGWRGGRGLAANSFRHTRSEEQAGVCIAQLAEARARVQPFADARRTTVAMLEGTYAAGAAAAGASAALAPAPAPAPVSTSRAVPPAAPMLRAERSVSPAPAPARATKRIRVGGD